jgi:hypothetical protein
MVNATNLNTFKFNFAESSHSRHDGNGLYTMPTKKLIVDSPELFPPTSRGAIHLMDMPNCMVQLHYEAAQGKLFLGDSIAWLKTLEPSSVDLIFADPPYNIKKAEWDDFGTMNAYVA